jgi:hypothetical protein
MSCCRDLIRASETLTNCECRPEAFPFACKRHGGCQKTEHFYGLCRNRLDYFNHWEEVGKDGPCLNREPLMIGLGDALAWIFGKIGLKPWEGCGCDRRRAWLNKITLWRRRAPK